MVNFANSRVRGNLWKFPSRTVLQWPPMFDNLPFLGCCTFLSHFLHYCFLESPHKEIVCTHIPLLGPTSRVSHTKTVNRKIFPHHLSCSKGATLFSHFTEPVSQVPCSDQRVACCSGKAMNLGESQSGVQIQPLPLTGWLTCVTLLKVFCLSESSLSHFKEG